MSLVACKECGKTISSEALICPNCGVKKPGKKVSGGTIFALGVIVFLITVALWPSGSRNKQVAEKSAVEEQVDYSKPLITKRGAVICPMGVIFDSRKGRGLDGLHDAEQTIFGRDEAFEKVGCATYQEGIPIYLTIDQQERAAAGKAYIYIRDGREFILSWGLQNDPKALNQPTPVPAQVVANTPAPDSAAKQILLNKEPTGVDAAIQTATSKIESQQPSFDCSKAKSDAEKLICSDPELARQDVELAKLSQQAKSRAANPQAFREETIKAWKLRETSCHDKACLLSWYEQRRTALMATQ